MLALITSVLYIECTVVSLLVMPFLSLDQWQRLLLSEYVQSVYKNLKPWIYVYILLVASFLLNSLRLMNGTIDPEMFKDDKKLLQYNLNQTIAQRNFYASGASIFLLALGRQLIQMKLTQPDEFLDYFNIDIQYKCRPPSDLPEAATFQTMDRQTVRNLSKELDLHVLSPPKSSDTNMLEKTESEDMTAKANYVMGAFYEQSRQD